MARIACVGAGPGGLFFATLIKRADPSVEVTVFERNQPDDTFGFGVVFSDTTLAGIHDADPVLRHGLARHGRHWDHIEVRLKGERVRCAGNGMAAISRRTLLVLLRQRAEEVGVDLRFQAAVTDPGALAGYDLIVAADGANSMFRRRFADVLVPEVDVAAAKFIWLGTTYRFDGLTFIHERGPHGTFAVHGYPISEDVGTFIVETDERSWRAAGLDEFDTGQPPGPSDEKTRQYLASLFAGQLDGHELLTNNSRWASFRTWRTRRWRAGNVVLLGDAAHTAHFSVGSGTKMAMEDAVALAGSLAAHRDDLDTALDAYETTRRPQVERIQSSARPSLSWWEQFAQYHDAFAPTQFTFHFLSRSIGRARIAERDPDLVARVEREWLATHGGTSPLDSPLELAGLSFRGRTVTLEAAGESEEAGGPVLAPSPGATGIRLHSAGDPPHGRVWGLWLAAPDDEDAVPAAAAVLDAAIPHRHPGPDAPAVVAVHSGTALARSLLAERARLRHGIPALIVEDSPDADRAATLILSGRADLVGSRRPPEARP